MINTGNLNREVNNFFLNMTDKIVLEWMFIGSRNLFQKLETFISNRKITFLSDGHLGSSYGLFIIESCTKCSKRTSKIKNTDKKYDLNDYTNLSNKYTINRKTFEMS